MGSRGHGRGMCRGMWERQGGVAEGTDVPSIGREHRGEVGNWHKSSQILLRADVSLFSIRPNAAG